MKENLSRVPEHLQSLDPEVALGKPFRIPEIIKLGEESYGFSGLHLPKNWHNADLTKIDTGSHNERFNDEMVQYPYRGSKLIYDEKILREIELDESSLTLNKKGEYEANNIKDPSRAIILHRHASLFLNNVNEGRYPYIHNTPRKGNFGAESGLLINFKTEHDARLKIKNNVNVFTRPNYCSQFEMNLQSMATDFDTRIKKVDFSSSGRLNFISLDNLQHSSAFYDARRDQYQFHGVDSASWAAFLYNSLSRYMNILIQ